MILWIILSGIIAYLIGSINSAILVGRAFGGDDIRTHGSGNAGTTNALRTYGKGAAACVVLGDVLKTVIAILAVKLFAYLLKVDEPTSRLMFYVASVCAVLGHNFPIYFNFHGGKGVLVSITCVFFADWRIGLIVLLFALLVMIIGKIVSVGSILGAIAFFVLTCVFHWGDAAMIIYAAILAGMVLWMHRENIKRLKNGTENKFTKSSK